MIAIEIPQQRIAEFCRRHHIRKLALFGSVLTDEFAPDSDVDVLVEFEPGHTPGWAIVSLEDELSHLLDGREVELATPANLHPLIKDQVLHDAQIIYAG